MYKSLITLLLILSSCNNIVTKEQYLASYETFIEEIKQNYSKYDEDVWKKKDDAFEKYSVELYNKFQTQLTISENIKIKRFDFVYALVRGNISLADLLSGKYNKVIIDCLTELKNVFYEASLLKKDVKDVISIDLLNKLINYK